MVSHDGRSFTHDRSQQNTNRDGAKFLVGHHEISVGCVLIEHARQHDQMCFVIAHIYLRDTPKVELASG